MGKVKLLTVEDLVKYCQDSNLKKFSSKDTGYKVCVQTPATFEVQDSSRRGLMRLKVKVFHLGENRNGSFVSEESAREAMPSIKNRPILAAIHQLNDGTWDFKDHATEMVEDEDGNWVEEYIERQVGSFSEEDPFLEYDEEKDKTYVCAYGWIPEEYTKASEIIKRKNGTKNSVELIIDEFSFNANKGYYQLDSFYVNGSTLLGSYEDGTEVGEGMLGSRADIVNFSAQENSLVDKVNELQNSVDNLLSAFSILKNEMKGGEKVNKFKELLAKYNLTAEQVKFEVEGLTDEELEIKFAEEFGETEPEVEPEVVEEPEPEVEPEVVEEPENKNSCRYQIGNLNFELFLEDLHYVIDSLVNATYSEQDNTFYSVILSAESNTCIMNDCLNGKSYRQSYGQTEDGSYALVGERVQVYTEYLTQEEVDALEEMRENYNELEEYKKGCERKKKRCELEEVLKRDYYKSVSGTEEFKKLFDNIEEYTVEQLEEKADAIYGKYCRFIKSQEPEKKFASKTKVGLDFSYTEKEAKEIDKRFGSFFKPEYK